MRKKVHWKRATAEAFVAEERRKKKVWRNQGKSEVDVSPDGKVLLLLNPFCGPDGRTRQRRTAQSG